MEAKGGTMIDRSANQSIHQALPGVTSVVDGAGRRIRSGQRMLPCTDLILWVLT